MNFETLPDATTETKKNVTEGEEAVNTSELAKQALEDQADLKALNALGKEQDGLAYQEALKSIKKEEPKSKEQAAEAREEKRMEVVTKALQMIIDNLESKLDKKGLGGFLNRKFGVEDEIKEHIAGAQVMQAQGLDRMNVPALYAFNKPGVHTDKSVRKEIAAMIKEEIAPEDQELFTDRLNLVGHQLTDVSQG